MSDVFFRLLLAASGHKLMDNLVFCYLAASVAGVITSLNLWTSNLSHAASIFTSLVYGLSPAVTMSLMYSINSEVSGAGCNIGQEYTINVMISGFGIFFGPIITGLILDLTGKDYQSVFVLTTLVYLLAACCFLVLKTLLISNRKNKRKQEDYEAFENDDCTGIY